MYKSVLLFNRECEKLTYGRRSTDISTVECTRSSTLTINSIRYWPGMLGSKKFPSQIDAIHESIVRRILLLKIKLSAGYHGLQ